MTLQYIYDRLTPYKHDINDAHPASGDTYCVSPDVITDAGFALEDMDKLPRNVYLGREIVSNGHKHDHETWTFSISGLRRALETNVSQVIKNAAQERRCV